jgi:hypothetical protein
MVHSCSIGMLMIDDACNVQWGILYPMRVERCTRSQLDGATVVFFKWP